MTLIRYLHLRTAEPGTANLLALANVSGISVDALLRGTVGEQSKKI